MEGLTPRYFVVRVHGLDENFATPITSLPCPILTDLPTLCLRTGSFSLRSCRASVILHGLAKCIIALDDMVRAIEHIISCERIAGPVNVLASEPVSNKEFAKVLGKILGRPVFLKIPEFILRLAMGEIAEAILAGDTRLKPDKLLATGFRFQFPDIETALRHELSK